MYQILMMRNLGIATRYASFEQRREDLTSAAESDYPFSREVIAAAVASAEKLDICPAERWPQRTGSHVYKIVRKLLSD